MSLNTSMSIAVQALVADTGALQTTNNNIANVNTPGYSRQVPILQSAAPTDEGQVSIGNGVVLEGVQSVRDELLQMQIQSQTTAQSGANAQLSSLQQLQPAFTTSAEDVGTTMSALFSSLSSLSTDPTSSVLRQGVLTAGQSLISAFNTASASLTAQQTGLNTQVDQDVSQVNQLTQQIAALNPQLAELKASGQDGGSIQDEQDQLVLSLSKLTSVSVTKTEGGDTLTTGNGTPLVEGSKSFALQTSTGSDAMQHVLDQSGNDITSSITGGDLGGTIQTRDQTIPGIMSSLNGLANQLGNAVNAAQKQGFDQNGNTGQNFFNVPATDAGPGGTTVMSISMAITDPKLIAASSDGSAGSNGNLANLSAIQSTNLSSGQSPIDTYSSLVDHVGSLTSNASSESTATTASLLQLNDQLSSVSGVSIDEESTNLITFQQAYQAAARVITVINSLFQVTMAMGTASAE
jgi:flagellar hook-associated protein 1 FlgK